MVIINSYIVTIQTDRESEMPNSTASTGMATFTTVTSRTVIIRTISIAEIAMYFFSGIAFTFIKTIEARSFKERDLASYCSTFFILLRLQEPYTG